MSNQVVDLDLLAGTPRKAKLGGTVYKLPADIPIPTMLLVESLREQADSDDGLDEDSVVRLYEDVLAMFQVHQPELERLPVSLTQLFTMLTAVYGGEGAEEPEGPTRPTRGATKPRTRAKKSSRSSTSSAS